MLVNMCGVNVSTSMCVVYTWCVWCLCVRECVRTCLRASLTQNCISVHRTRVCVSGREEPDHHDELLAQSGKYTKDSGA